MQVVSAVLGASAGCECDEGEVCRCGERVLQASFRQLNGQIKEELGGTKASQL